MLDGSMQKALTDRAEHIARKGAIDCSNKEQVVYFLTELRQWATTLLNHQLDGVV